MSGTYPSIPSLIDNTPVTTATTQQVALSARLETAKTALTTATAALATAQAAVKADITSAAAGNTVDPTANAAALATATTQANFAAALVDELESLIASGVRSLSAAQGQSYAAVFNQGVTMRIAAAQQADAAKASLASAVQLYGQAANYIQAAWQAGYPKTVDGAVLYPREIRSEAAEAALWGQ